MRSREDLALAVKKGAEVLDARYPEWHQAINLAQLQMESARSCVLGQLAQDHGRTYTEELEFLGFRGEEELDIEHGFDLGLEGDDKEAWIDLGELWTEQVKARRS